jgi:hypothetical protein
MAVEPLAAQCGEQRADRQAAAVSGDQIERAIFADKLPATAPGDRRERERSE